MSQELMRIEEEFAALAKESVKAEAGGAEFYKVQNGVLTFNGATIPNNEMAVVIVDGIHENVYYDKPYNPDEPGSPLCFAFGRDDKEMAPHEDCVKNGTAQAKKCKDCAHNDFGTARLGKGKACRNTRRLALIAAGQWKNGVYDAIKDSEYYSTTSLGFFRLPVTSVKLYKAYVNELDQNGKLHTAQVVTKVSVVPDAKRQFMVLFKKVMNVRDLDESIVPVLLKRVKDTMEIIGFPYVPGDADTAPKGGRGRKSKSEENPKY